MLSLLFFIALPNCFCMPLPDNDDNAPADPALPPPPPTTNMPAAPEFEVTSAPIPDNSTGGEGEYPYTDFTQILNSTNEQCKQNLTNCLPSEKYMLVCGSDGVTYKNIGVLACAQLCNIHFKLVNFGPCEGSILIPHTTLPPIPTTTMMNIHGILVDPRKLVKLENSNEEILESLRLRIKKRMKGYVLPPEWRKWCDKNPDVCHYGFHPKYNPAIYLIPTDDENAGYKDDVWRHEHAEMIKMKVAKLNGGVVHPKKGDGRHTSGLWGTVKEKEWF